MSDRTPGEADRASRVARSSRRPVAIVATLVATIVAGVLIANAGDDDPAQVIRSPGPSGAPAQATRLALAITGGADAAVAVVGSGGTSRPGALVLPPETTMVVPGAGERTVREMAGLPLEDMQVAISNGVGAWAAEAATIDLDDLVAGLEAAGGLQVNLPGVVTLGDAALGPGPTSLTPEQVGELLRTPSEDPERRWQAVLAAMLANPDRWTDAMQATDLQAALGILRGASGATPELAPTEVVGGTLLVPSQPAFDTTVADLFGTPAPIPVEVRNGTGQPGIGSVVGAAIVPLGFRVILSGNAESFDIRRTEIIANGSDQLTDAQVIHDALGVGAVRVSQVPSGIADVTIVIGEDLSA